MNLGFQDLLKNQLLSYFCWSSASESGTAPVEFYVPEMIYVGLFTNTGEGEADPVELVIGSKGYARTPVTFSTPVNGVIKNNIQVTFPKAIGGSWGKITHIGLFPSDGTDSMDEPLKDLLVLQQLSSVEEVLEGSVFELDINAIRINLV